MGSYQPLKTVERTMAVLEELNRHESSRVSDLHAITGIPSPTLVRILETLVSLGYVRKLSRLGGYCVSQGVIALSGGYHGLPKLFQGVQAAADTFTQDHLWPIAITTPDADAMIVRYSTIPQSPLSHKHSTLDRRLGMLKRAHGRAYLAHCPLEAREKVYELCVQCGQFDGSIPELRATMEPLLAGIRANGAAYRASDLEPDTMTIAVPLLINGQAVGAVGVTYFRRSLKDPAPLVEKLRALGRRIDLQGRVSAPEQAVNHPPSPATAQ